MNTASNNTLATYIFCNITRERLTHEERVCREIGYTNTADSLKRVLNGNADQADFNIAGNVCSVRIDSIRSILTRVNNFSKEAATYRAERDALKASLTYTAMFVG